VERIFLSLKIFAASMLADGFKRHTGMNIEDLRYFIAAYESGSFVGATRATGSVASNVSWRIRNLEGSLGGKLFERKHRRLEPTNKGVQLYGHAKTVMAMLAEAEREVRRARDI
jgi:DNA-binding transcriptional LysR family regulator